MRGTRYTEEQIVGILKEHEAGVGTEELCRPQGRAVKGLVRRAVRRSVVHYLGEDESVKQRLRELASGPDEVWSLDFVSDATAPGRRLKLLTTVDTYTRESLAVESIRRFRVSVWHGCWTR